MRIQLIDKCRCSQRVSASARSSVTRRVTRAPRTLFRRPGEGRRLKRPSLVYRVDKIDEYESVHACIIRFYTASRAAVLVGTTRGGERGVERGRAAIINLIREQLYDLRSRSVTRRSRVHYSGPYNFRRYARAG